MLALLLVAGPVALAVPVFVLLGRRWPEALGWAAVAGMVGAGIGIAAEANSQPGSGHGAFSPQVQVLGSLALAAVLAALALPAASPAAPATPRADVNADVAGAAADADARANADGSDEGLGVDDGKDQDGNGIGAHAALDGGVTGSASDPGHSEPDEGYRLGDYWTAGARER
jgi:arabinofuranan 3-O-arabinosyltransferase